MWQDHSEDSATGWHPNSVEIINNNGYSDSFTGLASGYSGTEPICTIVDEGCYAVTVSVGAYESEITWTLGGDTTAGSATTCYNIVGGTATPTTCDSTGCPATALLGRILEYEHQVPFSFTPSPSMSHTEPSCLNVALYL